MDARNIEHAANSVSDAHTQTTAAAQGLVLLLVELYKRKHKKQQTIEIKVNGKTKLKGVVKDGVFTPSVNKMTAQEIQVLRNYFSNIPNPPIKPDDFQVLVNGGTVFQTVDGQVTKQRSPNPESSAPTSSQAKPTQEPFSSPVYVDRFLDDYYPHTSQPTPPTSSSATPSPAVSTAPTEAPATAPAQATATTTSVSTAPTAPPVADRPPSSVTTQEPAIDVPYSLVDPVPVATDSNALIDSELDTTPEAVNGAERSPEPIVDPVLKPHQPVAPPSLDDELLTNPPRPPELNLGEFPADFGLASAKNISQDAVVASGDRALIQQYLAVEALRSDLNTDIDRAKHPGHEYLQPRIESLRTQINDRLPELDRRLQTLIGEGKYKVPSGSPTPSKQASQLPQSEMNKELALASNSLLRFSTGKKRGETRECARGDYQFKEVGGNLTVSDKNRGEILKVEGKTVTGSATAADVKNVSNAVESVKAQQVSTISKQKQSVAANTGILQKC
ncbi:MAG: hypothetical protein HC852_11030 [Acaryochloridaceae cyanobacterium RU_4_10]|nr:hypothetical protein [Acaryochloridaceae cyanobacterium RU_4_10]